MNLSRKSKGNLSEPGLRRRVEEKVGEDTLVEFHVGTTQRSVSLESLGPAACSATNLKEPQETTAKACKKRSASRLVLHCDRQGLRDPGIRRLTYGDLRPLRDQLTRS